MRVLLISTYELGHQPLHVASPAAALRAAGHDVAALDLAVEPLDPAKVDWADAVALSVPMHTAMRLGLAAARQVRERRPGVPVCLYGLYAPVSRELTAGVVDQVIAGEYEPALVAWADRLAARAESGGSAMADRHGGPSTLVELGRGRGAFGLPVREILPPLEAYAHLRHDGEHRIAGYVETTHGCRYRCRHCPVPTVYDGAFRVVPIETVLDDVARLVEAGAAHITFGDPDFLNGPGHARAIVRGMAQRFDDVTFDCTVKVEHVLRHAALWPEFAAAGCLFVVSAFETVDDVQLDLLDKGHTAADLSEAVAILRRHGIEVRPSWMPFTPWATPAQIRELLDFVVAHDLVGNVDPVQYSIRLLLPDGSLLLDRPELRPHLAGHDPERLTWVWHHPDPAVDALQQRLAELVARRRDDPVAAVFGDVYRAVSEAVAASGGVPAGAPQLDAGSTEGRPRLTEPWFC